MKHYVCPGCGGESLEAKDCDTDTCEMQGKALAECDCGDGEHAKILPRLV